MAPDQIEELKMSRVVETHEMHLKMQVPRTIFETLAHHSHAFFAIYEENLRVIYANPEIIRVAESKGLDPSNYSYLDLVDPSLRAERRRVIEECLNEKIVISVEGMFEGKLSLCSYCPIVDTDTGAVTLMVYGAPVPSTTNRIAGFESHSRRAANDDLGKLSQLTERELVVLRLIGLGYTTDQIAKTLCRSVKTIQGHRLSLGAKLGVSNRVELASIAIEAGLTRLGSEEEVSKVFRQSRLPS